MTLIYIGTLPGKDGYWAREKSTMEQPHYWKDYITGSIDMGAIPEPYLSQCHYYQHHIASLPVFEVHESLAKQLKIGQRIEDGSYLNQFQVWGLRKPNDHSLGWFPETKAAWDSYGLNFRRIILVPATEIIDTVKLTIYPVNRNVVKDLVVELDKWEQIRGATLSVEKYIPSDSSLSIPVTKIEPEQTLAEAAKSFAQKHLVFTDELVDYNQEMYAAFLAGASWKGEQKQTL